MITEKDFENEIERFLLEEGGYVQGKNSEYNKDTALFEEDVVAFIQATQPKKWARLEAGQKANAKAVLIRALCQELEVKGSLDVLRHGFRCYGKTFQMAYFMPNTSLNVESAVNYAANILKITRQVVTEDGERPDVVLSLNGIPVATVELKNVLSATRWTVLDAIKQYREARNPEGKLFAFKKRTLVHFAVDTEEVYMTTKLAGEQTYFLPFNRGNQGGKGNPPVEGNVKTAYLWEEILTRHSFLEIIARFLHLNVKEKKVRTESGLRLLQKETMIFPRFHQLDAVRKLITHSRENGAGRNYLIQHSAGSGKSNTIAWLAHQLSSLHNIDDKKVFNSVIVITDRVVLDRQLQATISQFEHKDGVVQKIEQNSQQLALAIAADVPIIITTIQKFPFVMTALSRQQANGLNVNITTEGKQFAVIVDEAHSSQSGEAAMELRKVLNKDGIIAAVMAEFLDDEDENGLSDEAKKQLFIEAAKRQRQPNLSFFAFTATPKWKTKALFDEPGENGDTPFHHYTMRQAIEEGFILDVLANYATWGQYFKLLKISENDKELSKSKAKKEMMRFVNLHPSVIAQKVEIIVEHFRTTTMHKIGGRAKAMVVTKGREAAVSYKLAFDEYIKEKGYTGIKSLVAFSGGITLKEAPEKEYTEALMNGIREADLPEQFATDNYQVLLVAEKYQTGFDQPLLHTMFVDKKLSGIQAVQTLSRLNRCANGKTDTFVLDFVNNPEEIYKAFKPFYEVTELGDIPSNEKLDELAATLDQWKIYFQQELQQFSEIWFGAKQKPTGAEHKQLNSLLDKAVARFLAIGGEIQQGFDDLSELKTEQQNLFKSQLKSYLNLYQFVSQIMDYSDDLHEQRYIYLRALQNKLPLDADRNKIDLSKDVVLHFYKLQKRSEGKILLGEGRAYPLKGATDVGTGGADATDELSNMVQEINGIYGTQFTIADQLFFEQIVEDALANDEIIGAAKNNTLESFTVYFADKLLDLLFKRMQGNEDISNQVMSDDSLRSRVVKRLAKQIYQRKD
ncbi:type I restriction endonuclease subunit R [Rodentibacter pneumotropicus]|uniref:type I restriction endonuclease subunit R n=1 Tax=Rodentibacter pneumotropicus TaxID=758 RepID=UPI000984D171|nr:type I restriction endonuclease [Rodentibacter pneumotropicus]OOF64976.1 restriction endonuclease subunit R [Rodentibacter pneumotropicus]THA18337.1 type I restriction endonuclease subunit R [Rodentibacter pneumotropicus]